MYVTKAWEGSEAEKGRKEGRLRETLKRMMKNAEMVTLRVDRVIEQAYV